jgi:hypothetical protein
MASLGLGHDRPEYHQKRQPPPTGQSRAQRVRKAVDLVGQLMRIRTVLTGWQGAPGLSTMYFFGVLPVPVTADAVDCVARVRAAWNGSVGLFTTSFKAQVQGAVDVIDETDGSLQGSLAGGSPAVVTGTNGANYESIATMALLQISSGTIINGRRVKGRLFLGPVATPNVTSAGELLGATGTTVASAFAGTLTGSGGSTPVVWHRPTPLAPTGGAGCPATVFTMPSTLSVLRSRRD